MQNSETPNMYYNYIRQILSENVDTNTLSIERESIFFYIFHHVHCYQNVQM